MTQNTPPPSMTQLPWGQAVGLLSFCAITLAGLVSQASPSVIVLRATTAGITTAIAVRSFVWLLELISQTEQTDQTPS
ncbi:MAG: hypothetical protein KDA85_15950 [Planctomycetaceae bacterium]|nr:hypothetical protein [Planctomycetaceae bacterium]